VALEDAGERTAVTETVTLFGQSLEITAVPFIQQDPWYQANKPGNSQAK
jgi:hypothetical protein